MNLTNLYGAMSAVLGFDMVAPLLSKLVGVLGPGLWDQVLSLSRRKKVKSIPGMMASIIIQLLSVAGSVAGSAGSSISCITSRMQAARRLEPSIVLYTAPPALPGWAKVPVDSCAA